MINHINWHSVEKDGWPTKKGNYLIVRRTNKPEGRVRTDYLYSIEPPEWSGHSLEEITHYIPIEDIPMPKANNGCREYYSQPYRAILDESGNIIFTNLPYSN